jgi:hypothetical protein
MDTPLEASGRWSRWPAAQARIFRRPAAAAERVAQIVKALREAAPEAALAACRLAGPEGPVLSVELDARRWPEGGGPLRERLSSFDPQREQELILPGEAASWKTALAALGEGGYLALAFREGESGRAAAPLLALAAQGLSLALRVEALEQERERQDGLCTIGEAVVGLTHGLNNCFNTMLLQAAVVQLKAPEPLRAEVALIRQEGMKAAARLRPLLRVREHRRAAWAPQDLNRAAAAALAGARQAGRVRAEWGASLPPVAAGPGELPRLLVLLLRVVLACQPGALRLRTVADGDGVRLMLEPEGTGERQTPIGLDALPESDDEADGAVDRLALESLARFLGGRVDAYRRDGGFAFVLSWPATR